MGHKPYLLTPLARQHLRAIRAYSRVTFGAVQTQRYFSDLDQGLVYAASHQAALPARAEILGKTSLFLHRIHSHCFLCKPLSEHQMIVAAILHQSMNMPERLKELQGMTSQQIKVIEAALQEH